MLIDKYKEFEPLLSLLSLKTLLLQFFYKLLLEKSTNKKKKL